MQINLITKDVDLQVINCYVSKQQTMLDSMTKHAKSKSISFLTRFNLKNEECWTILFHIRVKWPMHSS